MIAERRTPEKGTILEIRSVYFKQGLIALRLGNYVHFLNESMVMPGGIVQRIANGFIGNGLVIHLNQLITPIVIAI